MATTIQAPGSPAAVSIGTGTALAARDLAFDYDFRTRLVGIATVLCQAIVAENNGTSPASARCRFARQVLLNPQVYVYQSFAFLVPMDGVITALSGDEAVANRLGDLWDTLCDGF